MLDIVIPVFNEALNIEKCFNALSNQVKTAFQVWVVYDFPEDNTIPVIQKIKNQYLFPIHWIQNTITPGPAYAIQTGLKATQGEAVLVVMADLSDNMQDVDRMYQQVQQGADLVCGSRYMKGGKQMGGPWIKKVMSRIAGLSLYYLAQFPTHDATNNFKMYSRKFIHETDIQSTQGFVIGLELVTRAFIGHYQIREVPTIWTDRVAGQSKFKILKWLPLYLYWYCQALKFGVKKQLGLKSKNNLV
jgi:glycosyltransferase involved in cell wall biosynthesis